MTVGKAMTRGLLYIVGTGLAALMAVPAILALPSGSTAGSDTPVPLSGGATVTVFEATDGIEQHTFSMADVLAGVVFWTTAQLYERYSLTAEQGCLNISCYREPPYPCSGVATGNNIVAVRLDGVSGYPDGLWASVIVKYQIGVGGIEESRFNALGPDTQLGPALDSYCTYLGDYGSWIVLGFSVAGPAEVAAEVDFDPNVVNMASKGRWVTVFIELPEGLSVGDILVSSVMLNGVVPADGSHGAAIGDHDEDGVPDLMLKFSRTEVQNSLTAGQDQQITVTGSLGDGTRFVGGDTVSVLSTSPGHYFPIPSISST